MNNNVDFRKASIKKCQTQNDLYNDDFCLTESDFYPPSDDRVWTSNIEDINGGDNFADYCKYFFGMLNKNGYYDN